ncbi:MAG: UDP-3-O-acyl-N-acetylglucosamine deacetylase [Alphaproteobacteria bacterium]|nr:UDP-3-O-acyl-N-acetylglucosamine deacetylase [Alphaproteobacteria bacterium]
MKRGAHPAVANRRVQRQKTLKGPIHCSGIGLHSGSKVSVTLTPGAPDTGVVFVRTDLPAARAVIQANHRNVVDTRLCTAVANRHGAQVGTVEHLMAALAGCEIDNLQVHLNGPEVPAMDGSAEPFVFLIECAGVAEQAAPRRAIEVLRPVAAGSDAAFARLSPAAGALFSVEIDFDNAAVARQEYGLSLTQDSFKNELSRARTFGFLHEVDALRAQGLARGGSLDNAVVISGDKVLNEGGLRFEDEFVRHKVLDSVGDLYLAGAPICGHYRSLRAGHRLNNQLLRALLADERAWTYTWLDEVTGMPVGESMRMAASA